MFPWMWPYAISFCSESSAVLTTLGLFDSHASWNGIKYLHSRAQYWWEPERGLAQRRDAALQKREQPRQATFSEYSISAHRMSRAQRAQNNRNPFARVRDTDHVASGTRIWGMGRRRGESWGSKVQRWTRSVVWVEMGEESSPVDADKVAHR